jgi:hypothetical protein
MKQLAQVSASSSATCKKKMVKPPGEFLGSDLTFIARLALSFLV